MNQPFLPARKISDWAQKTALALRQVQTRLGPEDDEDEVISQTLQAHLSELSPEESDEALKALECLFPVMADLSASPIVPPSPEPSLPGSAKEMAAMIQSWAGNQPPEAVEELWKTLGLKPEGATSPAETGENPFQNLSDDAYKMLRLPRGRTIDPQHATRLLIQLLETLTQLEQFGWNFWAGVAPSSHRKAPYQNRGGLKPLAGRFLVADEGIQLSEIREGLDATRSLLVSLIGSLGRLGYALSTRCTERLNPDRVEEMVRMEGVKFLDNLEAKCWRKYRKISSDISQENLQKSIMEALVLQTEEFLSGKESSKK